MTKSRFTLKDRSFFSQTKSFVKYLSVLVMILGVAVGNLQAAISLSSPSSNYTIDFCASGGSASFSIPVVATTTNAGIGCSVAYEWYVGSVATGNRITSAGTPGYANFTTSSLDVNAAHNLGSTTQFYALLYETGGACNDTLIVGPLTYIKVTAAPTVTLNSSAVDFTEVNCQNTTASFTAAVTGPSPSGVLSYAWFKTPFGGAAGNVQNTNNTTTTNDNYSYPARWWMDQDEIFVNVTNACGTTTSATATLEVNPAPFVTVPSSMSSITACEGDGFSVSYSVDTATYGNRAGNANWTITATGDAALISLLTLTGSGNGTTTNPGIGAALTPGNYSATFTTITNTSDACARAIATNTINVTIYPKPTVTFASTPSNYCAETGSTTFAIQVANANYTTGGGSVDVAWQVTLTETSENIATSSCTAPATSGLLGTTYSGTGNGTFTFTAPGTLSPGNYSYTLTGITNTTNSCTGSVTGTNTVSWSVYPTPNITVVPTSTAVCEGGTANFSINVTNAQYCNAGTLTGADWSLSYTDATNSTIGASPLTGTGNGTSGPFTTSAALTSGVYVFDPGTITNTTLGHGGCNRAITSNNFTLTVNPAPSVTFSTNAITLCEGNSATFDMVVSNASLSGVGQNWTVTYGFTSFNALNGCNASPNPGIITGGQTGNGNTTKTFTVPSTLAPGIYTYTLNGVTNTSTGCSTSPLSASVGANGTITITVEPSPVITMNPDIKDVCENLTESFNLQITNTQGCSGASTTTTADWTLTSVTDNVNSNITTAIAGYPTGTGNQTYSITVNSPSTLSPDDHTLTASVYNTTAGSACAVGDATTDVFTLSVDPRPYVQINGAAGTQTIDVCEGTASSFTFVVTNAEQNGTSVDWEITYTESSGNLLTSCNNTSGANQDMPGASGAYQGTGNGTSTITVPSTLLPGRYTYTISNIQNLDGPCTGFVDGVMFGTQEVIINVYPRPNFTMSPDKDSVCENSTLTNAFSITVTNAEYCSAPNTKSDVNYEIAFVDNVDSDAGASPYAGAGNNTYTFDANSTPALAAGKYTFTTSAITTTGLPSTCSRSVVEEFELSVLPEPIVTFTATQVSVCEGSTGTLSIEVSNAELAGAPIDWSVVVTESSGNMPSSCLVNTSANKSIVTSFTGTGNKTGASALTYTIPATLEPGIYTYTLTSISNTSHGCDGFVSPVGTITVYVYPKIAVAVSPATGQVCEGDQTNFTLTVTNARYCTALNTASQNAPWTLNYTDNTASNIFPDPLTGSGNSTATFTANFGGALAPNVYTFTADDITANISTPTAASCPVTLTTNNTFTLTVNPEPVATFNASNVTVCEGSAGTFDLDISNATLAGSGVTWAIDITGDSTTTAVSCASGGAGAGIIPVAGTSDVTGTGNQTLTYNIPNTLAPGVYVYTINSITNTTPPCTGVVGANPTITIVVYPKPDVTLSTTALTVCENTDADFDLNVTNAQYCASVGGSLIDVNWEITHSDATAGNIPASIWTGNGNFTGTYTVNQAHTLTAGTYTFTVSQIENTTHSCVNTAVTNPTLTLTVDDLPVLTINSITPNVCKNTAATITYSVTDVAATDNWSFTFTTNGTTSPAVTGTGPVAGATVNTPVYTTIGAKSVTFSAITNTTTSCVGNMPATVSTNVLELPDVTGFAAKTSNTICSGLTNDYNFTVLYSAGKSWSISYTIDGVAQTPWTGTGNGTFTRTIPVQYHVDAAGANDTRAIVITNITWTGTTPACDNSSVTDPNADVIVNPRPWITLDPPTSVCVNSPATVDYTVAGVASGQSFSFNWYTTNPADGPNNIVGTANGDLVGSYTTDPLAPVGTSTTSVPLITNTTTGCDSSSWTENITVDPPSDAGTLSQSYTICDGDLGPYTFTLTGYVGSITQWDSSENLGYIYHNIGNAGNNTHTVTSPHLTTNYRVIVKSGACPADTSNDVILFVHPQPAADINDIDDSICAGSNITLDLGVTGVPNTHNWTIDYTVQVGAGAPAAATFTGTGSNATITQTLTNGGSGFPAGNVTVTLTKITNNNTGCDSVINVVKVVKVKSTPVGSTASTAQTLCYNSNGFVKWDGTAADGYVVGWQKKLPSASTWSNISGSAGDTLEFFGLQQTTMYRAVIENAPCTGQAFSSSVTITVLSNDPTANWYNLPSNNKHCASTTGTVDLKYEIWGTTGANWTLTLLEGDSLITRTGTGDKTGVNALTFTTSTGKLTETFSITLVKLVISSGSTTCTKNLDNTGIAVVTVIDQPNASLTSVTSPVCDGDSVVMVYNVSSVKSTENWKLSYTIAGVAKTVTGTGAGTFTYKIPHTVTGGNATQSVVLTSIENTSAINSASTTCTQSLSSSLNYVVRGTTVPGVIGSNASVCKGANGTVTQTTASTNGAVIVDWVSRSWNGTTWSSWTSTGNTATSQTYLSLQETTQYRAIYSNSPCDTAGSNTVTITVLELPFAVISAVTDDSICAGTTGDVELTVTNVAVGQTFSIGYSEGSITKTATFTQNATGIHTLTSGTLNATTLIQLNTIATTSGSPQCSNTLTSNGTITIIELPMAALTSVTTPVCTGDSVTMVYNVSNISSTETWSLAFTIDGNAKTVTGTGAGTFTHKIPHTVTGANGSQTVTLVSITNTSTPSTSGANCVSSLNSTLSYVVRSTTQPGTLGTSTTVCKGANGTVAQTVASSNGSVITDWESREWNGTAWTTWTSLGNTSTTQNYTGIQNTTEFRAVYMNSPCDSALSNVVTITVLELPFAEITNIVDDTICSGSDADFQITVTNVTVGQTFTVNYTEGSVAKTASLTQVAGGVHTLTTSSLTANTLIQLTAIATTSGTTCSNTLTSNGTVTVMDVPYATITSGPDTLCQMDKITFTVNVSNVGSTDNWRLIYELESDQDTIYGTGPGNVTHVDTDPNTAESAKIQLVEIVNLSNLGTCKSLNTDDWDIYIFKPTEAGTIAASDTICKGGSITISEVVGTPKTGVTVSWEYRPESSGNWTGITNNSTTLYVIGLNETTYYRAVYQNGVCDTVHSNTVKISVRELPMAVIGGSTTICAGDSTDLTITVSNVGSQDWVIEYLEGTQIRTLAGTGNGNHTLRVGNYSQTTDVTLRSIETTSGKPTCTNDNLNNNATATVSINPRPYATINSTVSPICENSASSFAVTVSNVKSNDSWTLTYNINTGIATNSTVSGTGPGTITVATPTIANSGTYSVELVSIVNNSTTCDSNLSQTMNIVVDETTDPGTVAGAATVCYASNSGTITHTPGNGSIVRWEKSEDNGVSWSSITSTASSYSYTNLTKTTLFRIVRQNGECAEAASPSVTVTVRELPVATISGSDTICANTAGSLVVSATNTYGESWAVEYLVGTVTDTMYVTAPLTSSTLTTPVLTTNTNVTLKKVWLTSGAPQCENSNLNTNAIATVRVDQLPSATFSSLQDSVCTGSGAAGVVSVTNVRSYENWTLTWTLNGGSADNTTGTGSGTFNMVTAGLTVNPTLVRLINIVNTTTGCSNTPTDAQTVVVSETTIGGTLSAPATVCKGDNQGTIALSGNRGNVVRWEYSQNGGATWTTINSTSTTYQYNDLDLTTIFRVLVKNGYCAAAYSSNLTITVNELPTATIAAVANSSICAGSSTSLTITIANVGSGMNWVLTYLEDSTQRTLTGTGSGNFTLNTQALTRTTDITLQSIQITSGSPQCFNGNLNNNHTRTIAVIANPVASITNYPSNICKGETPTVTVYVDEVLSGESWTVVYRVNNGANRSSTGVGPGQFDLNNMPQFNTEGSNGVRLVSITNTSTSPNCTSSLSDSITINVDSTSVGGTLNGPATVCSGDGGTLTLSGKRGDVVKWQYSTDGVNYYDIANTSTTLNFSNLTVRTWYRVMVQNGVCASALSSVHIVNVQELPTITISNPTQSICSGSSTTLTLTIGNVSTTSTWTATYTENGTAKTYTGGTGFSEVITFGPYTETTTITFNGITLTNGLLCGNSITETAVITVIENPSATIASVPDSLCEDDAISFQITVDDVDANVPWTVTFEVDGAGPYTKTGTGSGTFTVTTALQANPTTTTIELTRVALNTTLGCASTLSETATIKVSPTSEGGTLTPANSTICEGGNVTLTLSGETGFVQNWEYSENNGATWTVLSNKTKTLTATNISVTTLYRAFVKSGSCSGDYSTVATVTVIPTPMATVSSSDYVCPGDAATFILHVSDVPAGHNWSVRYRRNGTLVATAITGTGSGDFPFTVAGSTYNGNPTLITVDLVSITNTTHGCTNANLTSSATARVTPNPVANFIAGSTCEDSVVTFVNTSTIAEGSITSYKWYFGDGDSSFNGSPVHVYKAAGTYTVRLVAWSDNGCRGEITKTVTIHPNPVANFTFSNVCKNEVFTATDRSTVSSGSIVAWFWTFGDGSTSNVQNPSHTYAASGNYDVTLTVTTNNGCSHTVSKEITVYILPEANFVATPVCENTAMQFVNASAIGYGTMTYDWNFAGQGTSTVKDPQFTFNGFGSFNVELIATSNNGCKDTIVRAVVVHPAPVASFTVQPVCIGEASTFVNTSTSATGNIVEYFWDFGDMNFSGLENPTHVYAAAGTYNVNLRVKTDMGCEGTTTGQADVIALPDVELTANGPTEFCDGDSVILTGNANARTYEWTWGSNTASTSSVTVKTEGWVKLRITAPPIGCANEDSIFITVWPLPSIDAWPADKVGASADTINKGESIELHATGGVSYSWSPTTYLVSSTGPDVLADRMEETTTYTVTGTDANGCVNTDDVTIVVLDQFILRPYSVVTPNGDGLNDTWLIDNIWSYPEAEVIIFNRYGMEVYRGTGYQEDWDGTYNGNELPDGPYYYVIVHPDYPDTVYKGQINLVRERK